MFKLTNTLKKIANYLKKSANAEKSVRLNAFYIGSLFTLSRTIGALREAVISRFVDRDVYDMYTLAIKIPSVIRRLSSEGTLENAYVPSLSQFSKDEAMEGSKWITGVSSVIMTFSLITIYISIITAPYWSSILLSKVPPAGRVIFMDLFVVMLPIILMYFISSTCIAILHRHEVFIHANAGQSMANCFMVLTVIIGYSISDSYYTLALCTIVGAASHLIWQYYGARKLSRQGKEKFFPDIVAKYLLNIIAVMLVGFAIYSSFYGFRIQTKELHIYSVILGIVLFIFTICVVNMRKVVSDGTLEYGNIIPEPETKLSLAICLKSIAHYGLIYLAILEKVSFLKPFLYAINLIKIGLTAYLLLYIMIKGKDYIKSSILRRFRIVKNSFLILSVYFLLGILSIYSIYCNSIMQSVFILLLMLDRLYLFYQNNFLSDSLSDKVKSINKSFFKTSRDAFFGTGISQIMSSVSIAVSAQLGPGAPSYMSRADKINQFPIGILGVAFGVALLPRISRLISEARYAEAQKTYNKAIVLNMSLCVVVIIISLLISDTLARLFLGGKTTYKDIEIICRLFRLQLLALPSSVIIKTLYPIYFATGQSYIISRAATLQCMVDVTLKLAFLYMGVGLEGMALSWVIGAWVNSLFLMFNRCNHIKLFEPITNLVYRKN